MNLHIFIYLFLFLLLCYYISHVQSASSSSAFATSVKYKNPKVDKSLTNRKNKGVNDGDTDGDDDDASKFIKNDKTYFLVLYRNVIKSEIEASLKRSSRIYGIKLHLLNTKINESILFLL
jgi:hypothetical protein